MVCGIGCQFWSMSTLEKKRRDDVKEFGIDYENVIGLSYRKSATKSKTQDEP